MDVRFETTNLQYGADTKLKFFKFDNLVKGSLLGVNRLSRGRDLAGHSST